MKRLGWPSMLLATPLVALAALGPPSSVSGEEADIRAETVAPVPSGGQGGGAGTFPDERIEVKGRFRSFRLVSPRAVEGAKPLPLVFAFPGLKGDGRERMARYTGLDEIARKKGFLLAYLEALEGRWQLRVEENEDLDYFDALYRRITGQYNVDLNRVYAVGMSDGAYFTNLLASQRSDKIAAIASHSGGLGILGVKGIHARKKYAVMVIHGSDDSVVSLEQARKARDAYKEEGHEVVQVEIPELGHRWGAVARISERIWNFFEAHALR
ncbi:MAG: hypothetical protein HYU36_22650 [Planctomycetes bacterium]|nr:hypothetical protein [Planctomycetota bacterium]